MYSGLLTLPPTTATYDFLLNWYLVFGVGAGVIVISLLTIFTIRYRDRGERTPMPKHKVEGWKIVAITVLISITILTAAEYQTFAAFGNIEVPDNTTCLNNTGLPCVVVCVQAFQWGWNYTYPTSGMSCAQSYYTGLYSGGSGNLTVPMGRDIVLNITSTDVFHSMGITMLAEKEDAIPGRVNQMWFEVPALQVQTTPDVAAVKCNSAGTACLYVDAVRCFELCGVGHATMWANMTVVTQATWNSWTGGQSA
jgi:heme/copper-type cytochrome/quinol oxidase subunit 2